jgi:hypothetical protein
MKRKAIDLSDGVDELLTWARQFGRQDEVAAICPFQYCSQRDIAIARLSRILGTTFAVIGGFGKRGRLAMLGYANSGIPSFLSGRAEPEGRSGIARGLKPLGSD